MPGATMTPGIGMFLHLSGPCPYDRLNRGWRRCAFRDPMRTPSRGPPFTKDLAAGEVS